MFDSEVETVEALNRKKPVGGTERLLVVDDSPAITRLLERSLSRLGYEVETRTSSRDALETFRNDPDRFDLVLVDRIMPDPCGLELVQRMRRIRRELPVVMMTGCSDHTAILMAGVHNVITKPFAFPDLSSTIRDSLAEGRDRVGLNEKAVERLSTPERDFTPAAGPRWGST